MKFLIAGLGSIGRRHLRNLIDLGQQDIVLFRTHQGTIDDQEFINYPIETDLEAALGHQPDAVIVSNPTALHLKVALPAVERGIHLFLEKPISHSMDGVDQLQKAVKQSGSKVLVGFQFRYHPGLCRLQALLEQGAIGRPLSVRAHWGEYLPDWHPWEDYRLGYSARSDLGGGVLLTLCHPLDYLRALLGEVSALWAFTASSSDLGITVEDSAEIGLQFESGVIGSVHLNYTQRPHAHWLEIVGTGGTLRWDNHEGAVSCSTSKVNGWQKSPAPRNFERNDLFLEQMRHFTSLLQHDIEPRCTLNDGVQALKLALAAHESAQTGQLIKLKNYPV